MKKYILALRHFIPHLIAVAAITVAAIFFPLPIIETILITAFFTLLLPYMEKVKEVERQLKLDREAQGTIDASGSVTADTTSGSYRRVPQQSAVKASVPAPISTTESETFKVEAQAGRHTFLTPGLKAVAFFFGGLVAVGVIGYAFIYLLLYFFFYP